LYVAVWRYRVEDRHRERFETAYGPDGDWAQLFGRAEGYIGTELLRSQSGTDGHAHYMTLDRWRSEADWLRFKASHQEAYLALDRQFEALTAGEEMIGTFTRPS
jgi:heme-degrading monooxygenase HmoA